MFLKKNKIDLYLVFLLSLLVFMSYEIYADSSIWFLKKERIYETSGLFSLIELIQLILLVLNIIIILKNRIFLIKYLKNKAIFFLRLFIPIILIFEETSYFFRNIFYMINLNSFNGQGEFNFHNSKFLYIQIFKNLPILGDNPLTENINIQMILYGSLCLIFGLMGFLDNIGKFKFIFFEKRFFIYVMVYFFNISFSYILRYFQILNYELIFHEELLEIFYYQLLFLDVSYKIHYIKKYQFL